LQATRKESNILLFSQIIDNFSQIARENTLAEAGAAPPITVSPQEYAARWDEWSEVNPPLCDWIRKLPRPVGIFAQSDIQARRIAWAAREAGRSIPDDLALIGVDNDEVLCNLCSPPLSSVEQPTRQIGYWAAQMLDVLLRGETPPQPRVLLPPLGVVARGSTARHVDEDPLVCKALGYLRSHFQEDVPVEQVSGAVGSSRRSLERAFRANMGRSVLDELTRLRIAQACESLRSTSWTLDRVSENAGFRSLRQFHAVFLKKMGSTPAEYRRSFSLR
jgi:LacI family transcriptional regulator